MKTTRFIGLCMSIAVIVCMINANTLQAKSLYAITDHVGNDFIAFDITDDELGDSAEFSITKYDSGPVDVTIDSNFEMLFLTSEGNGIIIWASPKTMQEEGSLNIEVIYPQVGQLAGIVADEGKSLVYAVGRGDDKLYICAWDNEQRELVLMDPCNPEQPYECNDGGPPYVTLPGLEEGETVGVALNESTGRLYVSNDTTEVHYYDTDDWTHLGTRDLGRDVADISIDPCNAEHPALMYAGTYYAESGGHNYLIKHDLEADPCQVNPNTEQQVDPNYTSEVIIGVSVDVDTGLVYTTTSFRNLRVWDCSDPCFVCTHIEDLGGGVSGPAGLCVPTGDIYYKPPGFGLTNTDDVDEGECIEPWDDGDPNLIYNICYDPCEDDTNVVLTDYLPLEVDFYSASDSGSYDPCLHRVTWQIGTVAANDPCDCVQLVVRVNEYAKPGGVIENRCDMEGDTYSSNPAYSYTDVCCWGDDIIYVDEDAQGYNNGTSWEDAYVELTDAFASVHSCYSYDPCNPEPCPYAIWVAQGTYAPSDDIDAPLAHLATFALVEGLSMYGHFAGDETSIDQREFLISSDLNDPNDPNDPNDLDLNATFLGGYLECVTATDFFDYIITATGIDNAVIDGFTINHASEGGIYCQDADLLVNQCVFGNNRRGVHCVDSGSPALHDCEFTDNTYGIYCDNSDPNITNCTVGPDNATGIYCDDYSYPEITDTTILENTSHGLNIISYSYPLIRDCIISDNEGNGILCSSSTVVVEHSTIKNNIHNGISSSTSNLTVDECLIETNGYCGITLRNTSSPTITNSVIRENDDHGLHCNGVLSTTIKNNWIVDNGADGTGDGIYIESAGAVASIRNNTIVNNDGYGIRRSAGGDPAISNCIVWDNGTQASDNLSGSFNSVTYSCIEGGHAGTGNIDDDPCFYDPCNYHLVEASLCTDAGDTNPNYDGETDIDSDPRKVNGSVDIGGDEYYWSESDFDDDAVVNLSDFAILADAWLTDPCDNNYNELCDLADDDYIDIIDFATFAPDWLWKGAWLDDVVVMMRMGGGGSDGESLAIGSSLAATKKLPSRIAQFHKNSPTSKPTRYHKIKMLRELLAWLYEINDEMIEQVGIQDWKAFVKTVNDSVKDEIDNM